jgi:hypothetical protein
MKHFSGDALSFKRLLFFRLAGAWQKLSDKGDKNYKLYKLMQT